MKKAIKYSLLFLLIGVLVFGVLFYNYMRTGGLYSWGLGNKAFSINLVPFYESFSTASLFGARRLEKVLFFTGLGVVLQFVLLLANAKKIRYYVLSAIAVIAVIELVNAFTMHFTVFIDINNWMTYAVGLALGLCICRALVFFWKKSKKPILDMLQS